MGPGYVGLLPLDELKIPTDPNISISSVRSYLAIAMILCQDDLQLKHMLLWGELNNVWSAIFHCDLHPNGLEKWPESGPHAFTESESCWLDGTLRFLMKTAARPAGRPVRNKAAAAAAPPPPPGKAAPAPRDSRKDEAAHIASRKRSAGATVKTNKRFAYPIFCYCVSITSISALMLIMRNGMNYTHYCHYCYYTAFITV
jgi:hypothetical protein